MTYTYTLAYLFYSISFFSSYYRKNNPLPTDANDPSRIIQPLSFRTQDVEGFRYRVEDVMRAVTRVAVREARVKEIKMEMLNSEKLKVHFEDNPRELQLLKHDKVLRPSHVQPHLKHVPDYLLPPHLRMMTDDSMQSKRPRKRVHPSRLGGGRGNNNFKGKRDSDPLKSFQFNKGKKPNDRSRLIKKSKGQKKEAKRLKDKERKLKKKEKAAKTKAK